MNIKILYVLLSLAVATPVRADSVDEAAKCASTFYVLTSIAMLDEGLGQHFEKLSLLSSDLVAAYARYDRNVASWTNGDTRKLKSLYRNEIDRSQANGFGFLPYVKSCIGWTNRIGVHLGASQAAGQSVAEAISSSPRPSLDYDYPYADWETMEEIFYAAYSQWEAMGKVTPDDIYEALP